MTFREYIESLDDNTLIQIIKDYEKFEKEGSIGDATIRSVATKYLEEVNAPKHSIILWMEATVKEAYRVFAYRYLNGVK